MAVLALDIVACMVSESEATTLGTTDEARDRLEWTWGLGYTRLDEHLQKFTDPQRLLMDDTLLLIPHTDILLAISLRNFTVKFSLPRPHIQKVYKGAKSFEYLVVPVDPSSPLRPRILVSELPPHLAIATTGGKLMKAWGDLTGDAYGAVLVSLVQRSTMVANTDHPRPALDAHDIATILRIHRKWFLVDHVPQSFLSQDSDQTMVEAEDSPDAESTSASSSASDPSMDWDVGSSASCEHEPKRRLLPCDLPPDVQDVSVRPSTDGDDEADDAISCDSHIPGANDLEERGDDEADHRWLTGIKSWAEGAEVVADDELLVNDGQIKEDPREQARDATSLDLDAPDYLSKHTARTVT